MNEKILKRMLPLVYIICVVVLGVTGVDYYREIQAQKKRLLTIDKKVELENIGTSVKLETNKQNKDEEVTYEVKDDSIVKVDEQGNLVSVGNGTTTVTAINKDKTKIQTFVVSVGKEAIEDTKKEDKVDQLIEETKKEESANKNNSTSTNNNEQSSNQLQTNTNGTPSTTEPATVKVTGISLNSIGSDVYMNNTSTVNLTATVKPANASNKSVIWSSSNTSVATVINGTVSIKAPGTTTIVAKTSDGGYSDKYILNVRKRVVIVIGASQVLRMTWYKTSYSSNYNYNTNDGTLVYVSQSGTGIDYQTGTGFNFAKNTIDSYSGIKDYVTFYIYYPLPGNAIKNFSCDEISASNSTIIEYAKNYNSTIQQLKNSGYNVKGYIVSSHPIKVTQAKGGEYEKWLVTNENSNACTKNYRSNWKYFKFNKTIKSIVESSYGSNLKYLSLFSRIMETNNDKKNFSFKITYNTTDGMHWDSSTTVTYVNMMLGYTGEL